MSNVHPIKPIQGNKKTSGGNGGGNMEARVAKLESDVEFIKRDVAEIKDDVKDVKQDINDIKVQFAEMDGKFSSKFEAMPLKIITASTGILGVFLTAFYFALRYTLLPS